MRTQKKKNKLTKEQKKVLFQTVFGGLFIISVYNFIFISYLLH